MNIFMERKSDEEGDESAEDGGGDGDSAELRHVARAAAAPRERKPPRASLCRHTSYFFAGPRPVPAARFVPPHPIFAALPRRNVPARPALLTNHRPHAALHPRPHRRRIKRLGRLANIQYAHSHNALKPLAFLAHTLFYSYLSQIRRCSRSRPLAALSSPVRRCSNGVRCGKRVRVGRRRRRSSSSCCRI